MKGAAVALAVVTFSGVIAFAEGPPPALEAAEEPQAYSAAEAQGGDKPPTEESAGKTPQEESAPYICYDCRTYFATLSEYVEHIREEHPAKWESMENDYEGWFENYEAGRKKPSALTTTDKLVAVLWLIYTFSFLLPHVY